MEKYLFTSESVTEGHPDKLCDQVADAVLDAYLAKDEQARVACEVVATKELLLVTGEVTANSEVDIEAIARDTIRRIGYTDKQYGFDADTATVQVRMSHQSSDIAKGVNHSMDDDGLGAGDQGMMFGYATNETDTYMPMPIYLAHKLTRQLAAVRKRGQIEYLRPDGKSQITVEYKNGKPDRVEAVVLSAQHAPGIGKDKLTHDIVKCVIEPIIPIGMLDERTKYYINPTGSFVIGGPQGDAGLTGRKIIVDTYGGFSRHGGGALSGKDPTKVDRSAAYAARHAAKNLVASGFSDRLEIQIAYAIGIAAPLSITVDTFGTGKVSDEELLEIIKNRFDFRPSAILRDLQLQHPLYTPTATYGHFGRDDLDLPWERLEHVVNKKPH